MKYFLIVTHIAVLVICFYLPVWFVLRILLAAICWVSFYYTMKHHVLRQTDSSIQACQLYERNHWLLRDNKQARYYSLYSYSYSYSYSFFGTLLMILRFKQPKSWFSFPVVIARDTTNADDFRRFQVFLRCNVPKQ